MLDILVSRVLILKNKYLCIIRFELIILWRCDATRRDAIRQFEDFLCQQHSYLACSGTNTANKGVQCIMQCTGGALCRSVSIYRPTALASKLLAVIIDADEVQTVATRGMPFWRSQFDNHIGHVWISIIIIIKQKWGLLRAEKLTGRIWTRPVK